MNLRFCRQRWLLSLSPVFLIISSLLSIQLGVIASFTSRHLSFPLQSRRRVKRSLSTSRGHVNKNLHSVYMSNDHSSPAYSKSNIVRTSLLSLSFLGLTDTAYLTFARLFHPDSSLAFCDEQASCLSVLDSPFAAINIPFTDGMQIPLSFLGFISYALTTYLTLQTFQSRPIRISPTALLSLTTAMATFSSFLIYILVQVLHQTCPYCVLSAMVSITMAALCWFTDDWRSSSSSNQDTRISFKISNSNQPLFHIPSKALLGALSGLGTAFVAWTLFLPLGNVSSVAHSVETNVHPPTITASSSPEALRLGQKLHLLHAKMYGAYWCSHCYEQKQRLGHEVFEAGSKESPLVQYIECDADGYESQRKLCKERNIPGYPTWEIGGKLYPGEMFLDELEDIVQSVSTTVAVP